MFSILETPSRYMGNEVNSMQKQWNSVEIHVALAFPDSYEVGMSHLGIQILYDALNKREDSLAERVFAPAIDMEKKIVSSKYELCSLESKIPIKNFDMLGFSLLYEMNYTNVLNMLSLAKIPLFASKRKKKYPLIVAGGPCTFNPEPMADFFDAFVIGDGEEIIVSMINILKYWKNNKNFDKFFLMKKWSKMEGVYIPSFFEVSYNTERYQQLLPKYQNYIKIKKTTVDNLSKVPLSTKPIIPFGKPIHDRLKIEISRGCTRGCRFCQAGMIYRPVRERHPSEISSLIHEAIDTTGYENLSLLSLSTGDYSCIVTLLEELIQYSSITNVGISLPSLRAETLTPKIMKLIKKIRKTGFTIAPEAGSQRLRDLINKNICENSIFNTVETAFSLGWRVIKLYFMIGLPTERQEDLQAIVDLVTKLNSIRKKLVKSGKINVSIATFIPKSHTPFQWTKQISLYNSTKKIKWLKKQLNIPGIGFKWQDPKISFIEGILARGNRLCSQLIVSAHKKGCKFDAWSDYFNFSAWEKALKEMTTIPYNYNNTKLSLPWDHIDTCVSKHFLIQELEKSSSGKKTTDCRFGKCHNCGVCSSEQLQPVVHHSYFQTKDKRNYSYLHHPISTKQKYKKIKIAYSKIGESKYFGHLEMAKIFHRGIRRAKIPVKYSEGFHPAPKISFIDALPIGLESLNELMFIMVPFNMDANSLKKRINDQLPEGLRILHCSDEMYKNNFSKSKQLYLVKLNKGLFSYKKLNTFLNQTGSIILTSTSKNKIKKYDLKRFVVKIDLLNQKKIKIAMKKDSGRILRPPPVLDFIFQFNNRELEFAKIVKLV